MEVFAGFVEHVDTQAGKVIDGLDALGIRDNTIIFYIWGDNGSSAEGQNGSISELLAQNQNPQHDRAADRGRWTARRAGRARRPPRLTRCTTPAGRGRATRPSITPSSSPRTSAARATRWPLVAEAIKPDKTPRPQFHHVNDIGPTLYESRHHRAEGGGRFRAGPSTATSMVYTFDQAKAPGRKHTQYFDNNGSRGIYHDGWYACTFGPLFPWLTREPGARTWDADTGTSGSSTISPRRLHPVQRPRRLRSRAPRRDEDALPRRGEGEQGLPDRRRHLDAAASRGPHQDALTRLALRRERRRACRSSPAPGLGRVSNHVDD